MLNMAFSIDNSFFLSLLTKQRYLFNLISPDYYSTFAIGL